MVFFFLTHRGNWTLKPVERFENIYEKYFFIVRVVRYWYRLAREVVQLPSLEVFKRHEGRVQVM